MCVNETLPVHQSEHNCIGQTVQFKIFLAPPNEFEQGTMKRAPYVCVSLCVCVSMAPLREVSVVASHSTACRLWFSCGPPPGPTFGTQRKYTRGTCSHCFLDPSFIGLCVRVYFGCTFMCACVLNCAANYTRQCAGCLPDATSSLKPVNCI